MMLLSPITIANESLEFFERTEEGYLLPYENEEDLERAIHNIDIIVIFWLALKLVVDTATFMYIIWRLSNGK